MLTIQRENYIKTNNSFKKKELIYPLSSRGFFSEINNLALAVLYCMEEKINFKICTKKWVSGEWQDYFEPIFDEYNGIIPIPDDMYVVRRKDLYYNFYHKFIKRRTLVQTDVWHKMHQADFINRTFNIPSLGIKGSIYDAKKQIFTLILNYNLLIQEKLNFFIDSEILFIKESCGIHIRRGDKVFNKNNEAEFKEVHEYIDKALSIEPNINKFSICTDDFTVIEELKIKYPYFHFYTLCNSKKRGYIQKNFNALKKKNEKEEEVVSILTDSQILIHSKLFIGTYSSNISRFVCIMRNNVSCYSIDEKISPH